MKQEISLKECESIQTGEITLAAVMAVVAIAIVAVVVYKLFLSQQGSANIPGGWKFTWK